MSNRLKYKPGDKVLVVTCLRHGLKMSDMPCECSIVGQTFLILNVHKSLDSLGVIGYPVALTYSQIMLVERKK